MCYHSVLTLRVKSFLLWRGGEKPSISVRKLSLSLFVTILMYHMCWDMQHMNLNMTFRIFNDILDTDMLDNDNLRS